MTGTNAEALRALDALADHRHDCRCDDCATASATLRAFIEHVADRPVTLTPLEIEDQLGDKPATLENILEATQAADQKRRSIEGAPEPSRAAPAQEPVGTELKAACAGCDLPYGRFPDLIIPDHIWEQIAPRPDGGGVLCPTCLCARLTDAGLKCEGAFTSGPIQLVSEVRIREIIRSPPPDKAMAVAEELAKKAGRIVFFINFIEAAREVAGEPLKLGDTIVSYHAGGGTDWLTASDFWELRAALAAFAALKRER